MTLLVNKNNLFNEIMIKDFEFVEYENINEELVLVEKEAFRHFEMLKAHLNVEGIKIDIIDGYRSLEKQENMFLEYYKKYGMDNAIDKIDMPGLSEHHTGQAIDIILYKDNKWILDRNKLELEEDIFCKIHNVLKYFGFILRYPKGKENITGHYYEPWHIRYVGEDVSMEIDEDTLEEYIEKSIKS